MILKLWTFAVVFVFVGIAVGDAQNLAKDAGFESGAIQSPWETWKGKNGGSISVSSQEVYSGNFSAKLTGEELYLYQSVSLEPNTNYTISAAIKCESGQDVWFGIGNAYASSGESKYISNTSFELISWSFTTDASPGNNPVIYIWKGSGEGSIWLDNIYFEKEPENPIGNSGSYRTFYLSALGNDNNSGTNPQEAWKSVDRLNMEKLGPADRVFFEGGKVFNGTIVLNNFDNGQADAKIVIGSYGAGRATINSGTGSGLIAYDCSNISISNLNFKGNGRLSGNSGNGISFNYCKGIVINNIEIEGFQHSGLRIKSIGNDYRVTNVYSHNNGYAGIYVNGVTKSSLKDIYIANCRTINNPGDPTVTNNHSGNGIYIYKAGSVTIEYCEASNNGWDMPSKENGPGGIWVAEGNDILIQYCISHNNKTSTGAFDGLGFDLDGGTTNSTIQYCLSYNNEGSGYGVFQYPGATAWKNNTIRYCISENDGNTSAKGSISFWNGTGKADQLQGLEFYNNVVYNSRGAALSFINHTNSGFNFRNNIFVSKYNSIHNGVQGENFQGNCWYSFNGEFVVDSVIDFEQWALKNNQEMLNEQVVGKFANPLLNSPGNSSLTNPRLLKILEDYKILENSPAMHSGLDLKKNFEIEPGEHDFFGNAIKCGPGVDMGIHEFQDSTWQNQKLDLAEGWNIVSFRVVPADSDLLNVVSPLIEEGILTKVLDENGNTIENLNGWKNNIGNFQETEGYKIHVTSNSELNVEGFAILQTHEIPLSKGWNIIPWPLAEEQNGMDVVRNLIDEGHLLKVMDETGNSIEFWGDEFGWRNLIGSFKAGKGYKLKVSSDCILSIQKDRYKSKTAEINTLFSNHFVPVFEGNGTNHMNINLINSEQNGIRMGDEIGVFDGDLCVGSITIGGSDMSKNWQLLHIPVSAEDKIDSNNGFKNGNPVTLKIFRNGMEYPLNIGVLNKNEAWFEERGSLFALIDISTGIPGQLPGNEADLKCYPNPFHESVNIEFTLEKETEVNIKVLNQLGQNVAFVSKNIIYPKGKHHLVWDGRNMNNRKVSKGIYFVQFESNNWIGYQKIILSK